MSLNLLTYVERRRSFFALIPDSYSASMLDSFRDQVDLFCIRDSEYGAKNHLHI